MQVTIDDCTHVIDAGRVREMRYDPITRMSCLLEVWISKVRLWGCCRVLLSSITVNKHALFFAVGKRVFSRCQARLCHVFSRHEVCTTSPRRAMHLLPSQSACCSSEDAKPRPATSFPRRLIWTTPHPTWAYRISCLASPSALFFPFPLHAPKITRQAVVSERGERDVCALESAGASTPRLSTRSTCRLTRSQKCCGPRWRSSCYR